MKLIMSAPLTEYGLGKTEQVLLKLTESHVNTKSAHMGEQVLGNDYLMQ